MTETAQESFPSDDYRALGEAMDAIWRGLKGAMVALGIAGIMAFAEPVPYLGHIPRQTFLTLLALASFLVVGITRVCASLPRKSLPVLKRIAVVAGFAMLASPIAVTALRNYGIELPNLSYMPPILAGLLGSVIVLVYEAGVKAQKADVDSENDASVTIHDTRTLKGDRFWLWVSLAAWLLAANLLFWPWWRREAGGLDVFFGMAFFCLSWGGILMLCFVGIPLRTALNLAFKERRRQRLWETVMCVIAFVTMSVVAYMFIWVYPPSSMGY